MAIIAILELHLKPELVGRAREVTERALKATRGFDGCLGVDVLIDENNGAHWLLHERWESMAHDAAYREFRAGPGALADLAPLLSKEPGLTWFSAYE